ncbi:UPF0223 family protein [Lactobacillaceae bacterium L1_55_11]|nr:UPF0223 family protein [Lactobacillaceae bacterium L1_55_11]
MENYQLPIDANWDTADIIAVVNLVDDVLSVYEDGVRRNKFLKDYAAFKAVIPAMSEQKQFDRDFKRQTGHQIYQTAQWVSNQKGELVKR